MYHQKIDGESDNAKRRLRHTYITIFISKIEKVPRGIQGENSRSSGKLVSTIGA